MQNKTLNIIGIIALILVLVGFGAFYIWDNREQSKELAEFQKTEKQENEKQYARSDALAQYFESTKNAVDESIRGFIIYGDDYAAPRSNVTLTSNLTNKIDNELFYDINLNTSYNASLEKYRLSLSVDNHAVAEEDFNTILSRFGIMPLMIAEDFTIPEKEERAKVTFKTENNKAVTFKKQQSEKLGNVELSGIKGQIMFSSSDKGEYSYYFVRSSKGDEVKVKSGTKMQTDSMDYPTDLIPVVLFGNNDYSSVGEYVKRIKAIVDKQSKCGGRYIVVSRTASDSELDKAMKKQFNDNYIRIDDKTIGETDYVALSDSIFNKMDKLGYFDNIKASIEDTNKRIEEYDSKH